jgi:LPXTG-motif cell wall-anchored protein
MRTKGYLIALGVGIGTAVGVAMDDLPTWIAVGAAIGLALAGFSGRKKKENG